MDFSGGESLWHLVGVSFLWNLVWVSFKKSGGD